MMMMMMMMMMTMMMLMMDNNSLIVSTAFRLKDSYLLIVSVNENPILKM